MEQFIPFMLKYWYLFAALLAITGLLVGGEVKRRASGIPGLSPTKALLTLNQDGSLALDIRDNAEFRSGHLPDAKSIPLSELAGRLGELQKYQNAPVLVYCNSGARSMQACVQLKQAGFTQVHNLEGGITAWLNASLPVRKK